MVEAFWGYVILSSTSPSVYAVPSTIVGSASPVLLLFAPRLVAAAVDVAAAVRSFRRFPPFLLLFLLPLPFPVRSPWVAWDPGTPPAESRVVCYSFDWGRFAAVVAAAAGPRAAPVCRYYYYYYYYYYWPIIIIIIITIYR